MTRIQEIRKLLELTQSEFAFYLNITQGTYSQYESGRDIPRKYYPVLEKMGVNISWLLSGEGEPINGEKYSQFKKSQEDSEVKVVDSRLSPVVVLPVLKSNYRQAFARGARLKDKDVITREDDMDYKGAIIVKSDNDNMEPTIIAGEKLLCIPVLKEDINKIIGLVAITFGDFFMIKRIKENSPSSDELTLYSDGATSECITIKKEDISSIYKVYCSVYRKAL